MTIWDSATGATVSVTTTEIDPVLYPSLESYLNAGFKPAPAKGSTGWRILSGDRIRTGETVPAQSFIYQYLDTGGILKTGEEHWYVLGPNLVSVAGVTDRNLWLNLKVWDEIREMQESFVPARYTSPSDTYSLAYPTFWIEESSISYDYWVADAASTRNLYVQVFPEKNYARAEAYGNDNTVSGSDVASRKQVYSKRANPSYRMDYIRPASGGQSRLRGAVLITLGRGKCRVGIRRGRGRRLDSLTTDAGGDLPEGRRQAMRSLHTGRLATPPSLRSATATSPNRARRTRGCRF